MPLVWKRVIDSQAEKLKELDKEIRPFRQNWEEADSMKSSVESLQNRVTELESVDKSAGQAARNTGEHGQDRSSDRQVWEGPWTGSVGLGLLGAWLGPGGTLSTCCLRGSPQCRGDLSAEVPLAPRLILSL